MAYRYGNRAQQTLFPLSIEEYVDGNDPVRVYDAFIESLDFEEIGIDLDPCKVGNSEYDPVAMMKLLTFGYSYGIRSSRKLERATYHNVAFIWLTGGLKPDHKTIAEFRRKNTKALKKVLKACALMCMRLDLISGNILFVDGTKIRANASRSQIHDKKWYQDQLAVMEDRIDGLLKDCDSVDTNEKSLPSFLAVKKELKKADKLKRELQNIVTEFNTTERKRICRIDPDCALMHSAQGQHAAYNVQSVVDDKNGLIVNADVVSENTDLHQFSSQIKQAEEILGKNCETACADAGYANTDELIPIDAQGTKVVVPSQRQALHKSEGDFSKSHFIYDRENDCYICPAGNKLVPKGLDRPNKKHQYEMRPFSICLNCQYYGLCTRSKTGRRITRMFKEDMKLKFESMYEEKSSQEIYSRRKCKVEHPFGHIKRNLNVNSFLLRGIEGVKAEISLMATCFNISRLITIFSVNGLIEKLV